MASVNRGSANDSGAHCRPFTDHTGDNNSNHSSDNSNHNSDHSRHNDNNNNTMNTHSGEANTQSINGCTKSIDGYKVATAQLRLSVRRLFASRRNRDTETTYVTITTAAASRASPIDAGSNLNLHVVDCAVVVVDVAVVASKNETPTTNKLLLSSLLDNKVRHARTVDNLKLWPTFVSSSSSPSSPSSPSNTTDDSGNNGSTTAIIVLHCNNINNNNENENISKNYTDSITSSSSNFLTAPFTSDATNLDRQQHGAVASQDDAAGKATGRKRATSNKHASEQHRQSTMTQAKQRKESKNKIVKLNATTTNLSNNRQLSLAATPTATTATTTTTAAAAATTTTTTATTNKCNIDSDCCWPSPPLTVAENKINTSTRQHLHHQLSSATCLILFILQFGIIYESHYPSTLSSSSLMMASALDYRPKFSGSSLSSHYYQHYQRPNDKLLSKRFSEPQATGYKQDSRPFVHRYRNYFIPTTTTRSPPQPPASIKQPSQSSDEQSRLFAPINSHVGKTKSLTGSHSGPKSQTLAAQTTSPQSSSLYYYYQTAIDRHKQALMNYSSLVGQQTLTKQQTALTAPLYRNVIGDQQDFNAIKLGSVCRFSRDCSPHIQNAHCDGDNSTCQCLPYYVPLNSTVCLPPVLLSYSCQIDSQCTKKVSNSHCLEGVCQCQTDFVAHRKDKCLAPAVLNDYCLRDEQCKLNNQYSFCKWIIPHIYGKCKCPINHLMSSDHCYPRLGDECKLDEHCLIATLNSYCKKPTHRASRSQSIMSPRCACKEGYEMSANKMYCLTKLLVTTTTTTTPLPISTNQAPSLSRDRNNNTNQQLTGMRITTATPVSSLPLTATTSNYDDSLMNVTTINNQHHSNISTTTTTTSSPSSTTAKITTNTQQQTSSIISSISDGVTNNRIDSADLNKIVTSDYVTIPTTTLTTTPMDKQQALNGKNRITAEPTKDKIESDREQHMDKVEKEKNKYVIIQDNNNSSGKTQGNNDDLSGSMMIDIQSSLSQEFHLANLSQPLESMNASSTNDDTFVPTTPAFSLFSTTSSRAPETSTIDTKTDKYRDKHKHFSTTTKLPVPFTINKSDKSNNTSTMMKQPSGSNNTAATTTSTTTTTTESSVLDLHRYKAISLGKKCKHSKECQQRDPYSDCIDGYCECMRPTSQCSAKATGCLKDTYQCRNGQCISWYFVCDKFKNCDDGSDEDECIPHRCPKEAFQCDDGTCLQRSKVCNGHWECPDGSDEARCYKGISCDSNAFRCRNGQCLPQYVFCNAVEDCLDGSDEIEQICENNNMAQISTAVVSATSRQRKYHKKFGPPSRTIDSNSFNNDTTSNMLKCPAESFTCSNGKCRSTAILCSGVDGCGDGSDEDHCEVCSCESPLNSPLSYVDYGLTHLRKLRER